jgi:hypothetical protein
MEFVTIARALDADPLKLMTIRLSGGKIKSPRVKSGAKQGHLTSRGVPKRTVQPSP